MSRADGADVPFELVFTPDSTAWPVRWPERLMLKPVSGVFRGETRDYVPERTCRMDEVETGEVADYSDTDEVIFHCNSCHADRGIFSYDEDGNVYSARPEYCPCCGAKVVGDDREAEAMSVLRR